MLESPPQNSCQLLPLAGMVGIPASAISWNHNDFPLLQFMAELGLATTLHYALLTLFILRWTLCTDGIAELVRDRLGLRKEHFIINVEG